MKKLVSSLFLSILFLWTAAAQKSVTIVVIGEGSTKEEATLSALRSAIEQSYGTFVSSNTTILNDDLVKDEIVSISSGNIQNYKELSFSQMDNGHCTVSLETTVSLAKLTNFAQSKGAECELAGATFGANLKIAQFYFEAEGEAIENLLNELRQMLPSMYDYTLDVNDPKPEDVRHGETPSNYDLLFDVTIKANEATKQFCSTLVNTLNGLSMTNKAAAAFKEATGINPVEFYIDEDKFFSWGNMKIILRDEYNVKAIENFINNSLVKSMLSFEVEDNLGIKHTPSIYTEYESSFVKALQNGANRYSYRQTPFPEMDYHALTSDNSSGGSRRYSIRYLLNHTTYCYSFKIQIPMNEIGNYRNFTIRKR